MFDAIDRELAPGGVVVFGEIHGTLEAPAMIARAAEYAATRGPVTVAIEVPDDVQPGIDAFLATGERASLLVPSAFWSYRDGRGGEGLVALLAAVRSLRDVIVVAFDGSFESAEARDVGMAHAILRAIRPTAACLVSCGNLHARTSEPRWMGYHLRARHPALVALDVEIDGGAAFVATAEHAGLRDLGRTTGDPRRGVVRYAARDEHGFDGAYHVGPATPSLPLS